jgi:ABC-2 type transport system permease protein
MTAATSPLSPTDSTARSDRPVWWLVFRQELADLWVGGKALNLLILYGILMSITAFLLATNSELSLTPPRLMIVVMIQSAMTFGLFIGLVIASESISGERERATLEPLLLAPAGRRQIVLGKYLAALSPWPIAYAYCIPYVVVLSQGDLALWPALAWGALLGALVVIAFTGLGLLASMWSNSTRTSLFIGLLIYVLALLPANLPGEFSASAAGAVIQTIDPLEAVRQFMTQGFVEVRTVDQLWPLLYAPVLVTALILLVVFGFAAPRLDLEAATPRFSWSRSRGKEGAA